MSVDNFAGGISDFYLDAKSDRAQRIDNLNITSEMGQANRKLVMRPGRVLYDVNAPQIPVGNQRINKLIKHSLPDVLAYSSRQLYYKGAAAWVDLTGPSGNPAMGAGSLSTVVSDNEFRQHSLIVNDEFSDPMKVYQDENGVWQVRNASLPSIELEAAVEIANELKAKFNAHIADGAQHTSGIDVIDNITTASAYDQATLVNLTTRLIEAYSLHEADAALPAAWAYHAAQEAASHALTSTTPPTTIFECSVLLADLLTKYNSHDADGTAHAVASSHPVIMGAVPSVIGAVGSNSYLYRLHFETTYMVGDVTYIDRSATFQMNAFLLTVGAKTVIDIPVIDNGSNRNYDSLNTQVVISRTTNFGTLFYEAGRVTNGTTTFVDNVLDANLVFNTELYTNSGELDSDQAPACKYAIVVNNVAYYIRTKEGNTEYPNRYIQSKPNEVFTAPGSFEEDLPSPITGASWIGDFPIIFCLDRSYRIEGVIDSFGNGFTKAVEIPGNQGCIAHSGIIRMPGGIIFPTKGGFWYTNGYQMRPLSNGIIDTYNMITNSTVKRNRLQGYYDANLRRVMWSCQMFPDSLDVDTTIIMLLEDRLSEDMPFYTYSGGKQFPGNWAVTSMIELNNETLMSDSRGYVLKFSDTVDTDPKIEVLKPVSQWTTVAIIYDYRSFGFSAGNSGEKKTSYEVTLIARNNGLLAITPGVCNDDSGYFRVLKEIRGVSALPWGIPHKPWLTPNLPWGLSKLIEGVRNMPKFFFRWIYKQIQVTNAWTIIRGSDVFGLANLDAVAKTVTLNVVTETWPLDVVDYELGFENDGYVTRYNVASRVSDLQVTLDDPGATLVTAATTKWQLYGYRKGDKLELVSFTYPWAFAGPRLGQYKNTPTGTGKNA